MHKVAALLLVIFLAACNLPRFAIDPATPPPSVTPDYKNCYFNWATHSLPEISTKVQEAMDKAGLKDVTAFAEAYGENCYDSQTNEIAGFSAMETDFRVTVEVTDLQDTETLGNLLERILVVLDQFPTRSTPGPKPGYVGVRFHSGDQELYLWFLVEDGKAARDQGLHGAALLERLQKK